VRKARLILCVALICLGPSNAASAAVALSGPGGFAAGYVTPVVVIAPGEAITYANADIAPHNFVASDAYVPKKAAKKAKWCSGFDRGKCPLFWSETITAGATTEVEGLDAVVSGKQYGFYCSLHPNMKGTLIVR
jgi:plastocyanin